MIARLAAVISSAALVVGLTGATAAAATSVRPAGAAAGHGAAAALKCSPRTDQKLVSYGGPVYQTDFVGIVSWGSWWRRLLASAQLLPTERTRRPDLLSASSAWSPPRVSIAATTWNPSLSS